MSNLGDNYPLLAAPDALLGINHESGPYSERFPHPELYITRSLPIVAPPELSLNPLHHVPHSRAGGDGASGRTNFPSGLPPQTINFLLTLFLPLRFEIRQRFFSSTIPTADDHQDTHACIWPWHAPGRSTTTTLRRDGPGQDYDISTVYISPSTSSSSPESPFQLIPQRRYIHDLVSAVISGIPGADLETRRAYSEPQGTNPLLFNNLMKTVFAPGIPLRDGEGGFADGGFDLLWKWLCDGRIPGVVHGTEQWWYKLTPAGYLAWFFCCLAEDFWIDMGMGTGGNTMVAVTN